MQRNEIIKLAQDNGATIEAGKQPGTIIYEGTGGITFDVLARTVEAAVEKGRAEYEKDAARYRWLRNPDNQTREDSPCVSDDSFNTYFAEELDALIDSEMGANVKCGT